MASLEPRYFIAGSLTGFLCSFVSTPFELLKIQMQLHRVHFSGIADTAMKLARENGLVRGLFTGHGVNVIRELLFCGVYFGTYQHAKEAVRSTSVMAVPVAGGCAGALAWATSYPLDLVKTQIQGKRLVGNCTETVLPSEGAWSIAQRLVRTRGILGLFVGVGPSIGRAFIVSGSRFSAFEFAQWYLRDGEEV
jgi:solute carrier family 25 carnitine/acylcarnitine transporter 20/29